MTRKFLYWTLGILLVLAAAGMGYFFLKPASQPEVSPLIGKEIPSFTLPGLDGQPNGLTSSDLRGKPSVLTFFASWCMPCRLEHKMLQNLVKETHVSLNGIAFRDKAEVVEEWLEKYGDPYDKIGLDEQGKVSYLLDIQGGIPQSLVIDSSGTIVYHLQGALVDDKDFAAVKKAIKKAR